MRMHMAGGFAAGAKLWQNPDMDVTAETHNPTPRQLPGDQVTMSDLILLATEVQTLMRQAGWMLATAESCTGGLVGHVVTEVAGSSAYFAGGAVVYSYPAKERVVGVRHETLAQVGAVSPEVAAQMAQGARRLYAVDVAVAVTGIAGPGGDGPGKPTGTTYIHLSATHAEWGRHYVWRGNRSQNKLESARAALELVRAYAQQYYGESRADP